MILGYSIYYTVIGQAVLGMEWVQINTGENVAAVWKFGDKDMATKYFQSKNIQQYVLIRGTCSKVDSVYSKLEMTPTKQDFKLFKETNMLGLFDNFSMMGETLDAKFNKWIANNDLEIIR
jgi:hypothetical protein